MKWGTKTNKRIAAVTVSFALHLLVFFGLTMSSGVKLANATLAGEGQADVEGIQLDLVGIDDADAAAARAFQAPAPQHSRMDAFMQMTDQTGPPTEMAFKKPNPAQSISDALGENPFDQQAASRPQARSSTENHVSDNASRPTPNDLWKAIAPCWNRIADKNTQAVILEVSFSPMGNLARPPVIKRSPSKPITDQMLRSESQAIAALSQCGPYLMVFGQENVSVGFPKREG